MRLFYFPDLTSQPLLLTPEESKHCIRVLRMKAGDYVEVTNGKGLSARAVITDANPSQTVLSINTPPVYHEFPGIRLNLAVAITRHSDRFEWLLEKATETGVHTITPVLCKRSETRGNLKRSRLEKILLSAMKQSQRYYLPLLDEPVNLNDFIAVHKGGYIAWCGEKNLPHLKEKLTGHDSPVNLLIGPEGDFTEEEYNLAVENGYTGINLGPYRLRTETAALVGCVLIKLAYE